MSYAYDLIIVGAGPAGIFTALELLRKSARPQELKILLIEKGKPVERRHCPKAETGHCVNCKPTCAITTGFSGAMSCFVSQEARHNDRIDNVISFVFMIRSF